MAVKPLPEWAQSRQGFVQAAQAQRAAWCTDYLMFLMHNLQCSFPLQGEHLEMLTQAMGLCNNISPAALVYCSHALRFERVGHVDEEDDE